VRSVDEHLSAVLEPVRPLAELALTLLDAHGCVLAEDIVATHPLPGFDNSAMDGYAVRLDDVAGAGPDSPVELPVAADIAAGHQGLAVVRPGRAARIMTGAPLPEGAEAVVPVEDTSAHDVVGQFTDRVQMVRIHKAPAAGQHIRRAGEDVKAGETVLKAGAFLGAAQIGLLAAVGRDQVRVRPRPRVVIISTGSELVDVGEELRPGQIHDSNSYALTAAAREAGAIAYRVGIVGDDPGELLARIEDQLIRADLVVTSGGVSAGAYDTVKEVLSKLGTVTFTKVAMQPGMPQGFGTIGPDATPIFTLPGNPVSAFVSFEVFVRPVLRRMLGAEPLYRPMVRARINQTLRFNPGRRKFLRAQLTVEDGSYVVNLVGEQGSHLVADLALANALVVIPEDVEEVPQGSGVVVMMLERRSG
jgi:molybdopterin molybdotransferase